MLLQFRKLTRGAIAGGILLLIGIATVLFLPSGASFTASLSSELAKVGRYAITAPQLSRELDLTLRGQRAQGNNVTEQEAIDAGVHTRLLEAMIGRYAFYSYADKLGISASDHQVGERIREIPRVSNPITGQFDREAYAAFLRDLNYTQPEFERDIRGDITNQMLIDSLVSGVRPPSSFGALELAYNAETRVVSVADATPAAVGTVPPPTDAQLQQFYQENQSNLRVPEFRTLTLVLARPEDFVSRVQVPEAQVAQEVEARRASLGGPERRTFVRITAQNQQQANTAAQRLAAGEAPAAVAQALGLQMTRAENQARTEVSDPAVAEAVFSLAAGAPPRVVQSRLVPFVVVRVESITAAPAADANALRAEVRDQLAHEAASDLLQQALDDYEEARSGGATLAEAARAHGLPVVSVPAVTAQGRDMNGQPVAALEGYAEALRTAFELNEGEASDFIPADTGDVMVSVDAVRPESVRPFAEVRDVLRQGWTERETAQRLQALGREISAAVAGGQSFQDAARAHGFTIRARSQTFDRRSMGPMAGQVFNAREGDVVSTLAPSGVVIAVQIEHVNRVNPAEHPQVVETARAGAQRALQGSLVQAVQAQVVEQMHPSRNQRQIDRNFRRSSETEDEAGS